MMSERMMVKMETEERSESRSFCHNGKRKAQQAHKEALKLSTLHQSLVALHLTSP